jgi:SNF2 family DNA or RNA helicase
VPLFRHEQRTSDQLRAPAQGTTRRLPVPDRRPMALQAVFDPSLREYLAKRPSAFISEGRIIAATRFNDRESMKLISNGRYDGRTQTWSFPMSARVASQIREAITEGLNEHPDFKALADAGSNATPVDVDTTLPIPLTKTTPWAHQRAAFWFQATIPYDAVMLDMYMGTGKSKTFCDIVANRNARLVLIVCPSNVVNIWPKQFRLHSPIDFEICVLNEGSVAQKADYARRMIAWAKEVNKRLVVIINYESAWRPPFGPTRNARNQIVERGLALETQWDIVGADEIHKIKAPSGVSSRFMRMLRRSASYRVGMTGTVMPHSPLDVWAQYAFLEPSLFGENFVTFRKRIAVMGGYEMHEIQNWINQDWLASQMSRITFTAGQDVLDLPPVQHETRYCKLSDKATKTYRQLEKEFYAEVAEYVKDENRTGDERVSITNVLVKLLRCQQVTSGYVRDDQGKNIRVDTSKQELLADLLDDIPTRWVNGKVEREPVVVFARFSHDLDVIRQTAEKAGLRYKELSGRVKELGPDSTYPDECDVFGVQVQAGGVGIDLTRARYGIYYSIDRSLGNYDQTLARLHRPGQTQHTFFYHLLAEETIDDTIYIALEQRRDVVAVVANMLKRDREGNRLVDLGDIPDPDVEDEAPSAWRR